VLLLLLLLLLLLVLLLATARILSGPLIFQQAIKAASDDGDGSRPTAQGIQR
jgi:hypothetical protein